MQEMVIYGVSFDMVGKQPIVLLKTVDSNKFLPIWLTHYNFTRNHSSISDRPPISRVRDQPRHDT